MPARIPFPDDEAVAMALDGAPRTMRPAAKHGHLTNVFRMLMYSPGIGVQVAQLESAIFASSALSEIDRELAILACGSCFGVRYEMSEHEPIFRAVGVSDEQRAAVAARNLTARCLSPRQRALLVFVAAVADAPAVPDTVYNAMQFHYSDRQIVEVIALTGYYFLIGRLTTVLNVSLDPAADDVIPCAGRAMPSGRR